MDFSDSTIHGIHRLGDDTKANCFWITTFLLCVAGLSGEITSLVRQYREFRTTSEIQIENMQELLFPAVTICPLNPFKISTLNLSKELNNIQASYNYAVQKERGGPIRPVPPFAPLPTNVANATAPNMTHHCPRGYTHELGAKCYAAASSPHSLPASRQECRDLDANRFALPVSQEENDFLVQNFVDVFGYPMPLPVLNMQAPFMTDFRTDDFITGLVGGSALTFSNWNSGLHRQRGRLIADGTWERLDGPALVSRNNTYVCESEKKVVCFVLNLAHADPEIPAGSMLYEGENVTYTARSGYAIRSAVASKECRSDNTWFGEIEITEELKPGDPLYLHFDINDLTTMEKTLYEEEKNRLSLNSTDELVLSTQARNAMTSPAMSLDSSLRDRMTSAASEIGPIRNFGEGSMNESDFSSFPHAIFGKCLTFNKQSTAVALGTGAGKGLKLTILNQLDEQLFTAETLGGVIQVHDPNVISFPEVFGVHLSTGTDYLMTFTKTVYQRLATCTNNRSIIAPIYGSSFEYSHEACVRTCVQQHVVAALGCFEPTSAKLLNDSRPYCSPTDVNMSDAVLRSNKLCKCLPPCRETVYATTLSQARWPIGLDRKGQICRSVQQSFCDVQETMLVLSINYAESSYNIEQEQRLMSEHLLIAKILNAFGIWLGVSMMSVVEIVLLFLKVKDVNDEVELLY